MGNPTLLLGTWDFEREIDDIRSGERSTASGRLTLAAITPDSIVWREVATLHHAGLSLPAHRTLRVERRPGPEADLSNSSWHVYFEDGRYFHPWSTEVPLIHPCGEDLYEGTVTLDLTTDPIPAWQTTWRVRGPHKDLHIQTHLARP